MNANSGIISNSGNTVGVSQTCAVFARRDLTFPEPAPASELYKRGGSCACQCGRRRSAVEMMPGDVKPLEAKIEAGCKLMRDDETGAYYWKGSCARSTVQGNAVMKLFAQYPL